MEKGKALHTINTRLHRYFFAKMEEEKRSLSNYHPLTLAFLPPKTEQNSKEQIKKKSCLLTETKINFDFE